MTTTTKTPIAGPLPGYLHVHRLGTFVGKQQPIALMCACPCGKWHSHGAGTVQDPHAYRPGSITTRAGHCLTYSYSQIEIQADPFRMSWETNRGRLTVAYRRTRPLGCPRCTRFGAGDLRTPNIGTCAMPSCTVGTWHRPTGVVLTTV